jgi:hypothetical protein
MKIETIPQTRLERSDAVRAPNSVSVELSPPQSGARLNSVNQPSNGANALQTFNITIQIVMDNNGVQSVQARTLPRSA